MMSTCITRDRGVLPEFLLLMHLLSAKTFVGMIELYLN